MAYDITWRVMAWYIIWPGKLEVLFTRTEPVLSRGTITCMLHSLWAVIVN